MKDEEIKQLQKAVSTIAGYIKSLEPEEGVCYSFSQQYRDRINKDGHVCHRFGEVVWMLKSKYAANTIQRILMEANVERVVNIQEEVNEEIKTD